MSIKYNQSTHADVYICSDTGLLLPFDKFVFKANPGIMFYDYDCTTHIQTAFTLDLLTLSQPPTYIFTKAN